MSEYIMCVNHYATLGNVEVPLEVADLKSILTSFSTEVGELYALAHTSFVCCGLECNRFLLLPNFTFVTRHGVLSCSYTPLNLLSKEE